MPASTGKGPGGARPGAGRPKGARNKVTIETKQTVAEIAQQYTERAIRVLVEIMEKGATEGARVTAANSILDRAHGKPVQAVVGVGDEDAAPLNIRMVTAEAQANVRITRHNG